MSSSSSSPALWSKDTVAVVTGANKGLGYEIARLLAEQGLTVVLTARDSGRGQAALDALKADGQESIWFHQLDVLSSDSVETLSTWLKNAFGGIDILVNNAGVAFGPTGDSVDFENAKAILDTNYYGVKKVTQGLLPLLRPSPAAARIVNVTTVLGVYERLRSETLKQKFRDEDNYTEDLIDSLAKKYLEDVKLNQSDEEGWVGGEGGRAPLYSVSKMLLNAYSVFLARSLSKLQPEDHQILVTTFAPGIILTDLMKRGIQEGWLSKGVSSNTSIPPDFRPKSPAEGADTGVWLALLPKDEVAKKHGKFFLDRKEFSFGAGRT